MTAELLSLDFISPRAVPATWVGLGHLAAVPGLGPELGAALLERIAEPLDVWPEARVEGLLAMYPAVEPELQARIEDLLRRVLRAEEPSRPVLRACLAGLERLVARRTPRAVEGLVADLCRSILFRSREESLQRLLNQALSDEAAGDGVRLPAPWDREDRERALQILGLLALRPDLSPRLKRMILVRLFSFLDDWLDVVERGTNLYEARDSALWAVLTSILEAGGGQEVVARAEEACLRVLELHRRVPARLALDRRENVQRFLLAALARCGQVEVRVRGVGLDLRQLILRTVMDLASGGDSQVTRHLLRQTARLGVLPGPLQEELDSFLDRQPP
ncbi:MAG TPA: hypothetical protein VNO81_14210 [Candidatus Nitrosotenuis sp.]|nr:hypothetical protein [Candidatus Nitrosotenuis sp.]